MINNICWNIFWQCAFVGSLRVCKRKSRFDLWGEQKPLLLPPHLCLLCGSPCPLIKG